MSNHYMVSNQHRIKVYDQAGLSVAKRSLTVKHSYGIIGFIYLLFKGLQATMGVRNMDKHST